MEVAAIGGAAVGATTGVATGETDCGAKVGACCDGVVAGFMACACAWGIRACEKIAAPKMIPKDLQIKVLIALTRQAFGARIRSRPSTQVA